MNHDIIRQIVATVRSLKSEAPVAAGQLAFLGLGEISEKLGEERWTRFSLAINQLVEKVIGEICSPADAFFKLSDDQYLLIFANSSEEVAEVKAATIGSRISQSLFGKEELEGVKVITAGRSADGIDELLSRTPAEVVEDLKKRTSEKRSARPGSLPEEALEMEVAGSGISMDRDARRAKLLQSLHSAKAQPLVYQFMPFWHASTRRVATFQCFGMRHVGLTGLEEDSYDVLGLAPGSESVIQHDVDVMEETLIALTASLRRGSRVHMVLSLHFDTVGSTHGRDRITEVLKVVPPDIRSFLSIHICGVPSGVPQTRLAEICTYLRPYCTNLSIDVERGWTIAEYKNLFIRLKGAGLQYFGVTMRNDGGRPEVQDLIRIAELGLAYRISGVIRNVSVAADALELVSGGYEYCGGKLFGGPYEHLPSPYSFTTGDLEKV